MITGKKITEEMIRVFSSGVAIWQCVGCGLKFTQPAHEEPQMPDHRAWSRGADGFCRGPYKNLYQPSELE